LEEISRLCLSRTEYLKARIARLERFSIGCSAPSFNEIVVRREEGKAAPLLAALAAKGILAGVDLGRFYPDRDHEILVAVTERHSREDLDRLVDALAST
ncbi:MAG: glycine dehydrogenase, partial [Sandaracinaceae bacterium]|nr:glycine dehydrogenase [Sandaracinaceae bacterium]